MFEIIYAGIFIIISSWICATVIIWIEEKAKPGGYTDNFKKKQAEISAKSEFHKYMGDIFEPGTVRIRREHRVSFTEESVFGEPEELGIKCPCCAGDEWSVRDKFKKCTFCGNKVPN